MSTPQPPKKRKKETFTISFRVEARHLSQLEKGAAPTHLSVHEYARLKLLETLERQDEAHLLENTIATRRGVDELRSDLATTLEVILLNTTQTNPERIRDWINTHLRHGDDD